ncbi:MAG: DUF3149 domain-containing protein [Rhodocyclales bacterium]|nr:DUF3149 domain-containing protein [Rhodocyclales bacterium]
MAWNLLLTSDIGLLSLFTIFFCVAMAVYIVYFVKQRAATELKNGAASNQVPSSH